LKWVRADEVFAGGVELQLPNVDLARAAFASELLNLAVRFHRGVLAVREDALGLVVGAGGFREVRHRSGLLRSVGEEHEDFGPKV
jgi:hypothetical protein